MTYTANQPKPLREVIVARIGSETGKTVGEGKAPDVDPPFPVYHPLPNEASSGSLDDPDADVWWNFQVTCVGDDLDEAEWMQGKVRSAILGWTPTVAGMSLSKVELASGSGSTPDRDVRPGLQFTADVFRVHSAPS